MEERYQILNEKQLHFDVGEGDIVLFDTSMDYDGQKFKTSEEILAFLLNKYSASK